MTPTYRVLWFDDEHEKFSAYKSKALELKIELYGVSNAKEGLRLLEESPEAFNAAIVDGLFLIDGKDKGKEPDTTEAFSSVANRLREMKIKDQSIPWFIFSGKEKIRSGDSDAVKYLAEKDYADGKVFDKLNSEDFTILCHKIIEACSNQERYKIKAKYSEPFQAFGEYLLPLHLETKLLKVIEAMEASKYDNDHFGSLRKIFEGIMIDLHDQRLLPDECFKLEHGLPNLAYVVDYFCSREGYKKNRGDKGIKPAGDEIPSYPVQYAIRYLKDISSSGSHIGDGTKMPYALKSATYALFQILIWYEDLICRKRM